MKNTEYTVTVLDEKPDNVPAAGTGNHPTTFSKNLRKFRTYRNITRKYMAQQLHVSASAYGKWEMGIREPHTELIIRIAEVLGIPVGRLFEKD